DLRGARCDPLAREGAHEVANRTLLVAQQLVRHAPSLDWAGGSRGQAVILEGGLVRTMAPEIPVQRALAIAGDRIAGGVGVHESALASPEVVDLGGRIVVPGFTDSHVHFPSWALARSQIVLEGCTSLAEALDRIRTADRGPGDVIRGRGWRSGDWMDGAEP